MKRLNKYVLLIVTSIIIFLSVPTTSYPGKCLKTSTPSEISLDSPNNDDEKWNEDPV